MAVLFVMSIRTSDLGVCEGRGRLVGAWRILGGRRTEEKEAKSGRSGLGLLRCVLGGEGVLVGGWERL